MAFITEYTKYLSSFHTAIYAQKDDNDDDDDDEEDAEDDEILLI